MEPVMLAILEAIVGAVVGAVVSPFFRVVYRRLKELFKHKFGDDSKVVKAVERVDARPDAEGRNPIARPISTNTKPRPQYEPDSRKRVRLVRLLAMYLAFIFVLGLFMFDTQVLSLVLPLLTFSSLVALGATYRYAPDFDITAIRAILEANLQGVARLIGTTDIAAVYGIPDADRARLRALAGSRESLARVQDLYARHPRKDRRPRDSWLVAAELALLLLGASIGQVVAEPFAPPAGISSVIWRNPGGLFQAIWGGVTELPFLAMIVSFSGLNILGVWWQRQDRRRFAEWVRQDPQTVVCSWLPSTEEVRRKFRKQIGYAGRLGGYDPEMESAVRDLYGLGDAKKWRLSGLNTVQLMMLLFCTGLILGGVLPALLGLSR